MYIFAIYSTTNKYSLPKTSFYLHYNANIQIFLTSKRIFEIEMHILLNIY